MGKKKAGKMATLLDIGGDTKNINIGKGSRGEKEQLIKEMHLRAQNLKLRVAVFFSIALNLLLAQIVWIHLARQTVTLEKIAELQLNNQEHLMKFLNHFLQG